MRLLFDANLSPVVARALNDGPHDAIHVHDIGMLSATDEEITEFAANDDRVIVTFDTDFGTLLAKSGNLQPSVILLRHHNQAAPDEQVALVQLVLAAAGADLVRGAIATLSRGHLRIRQLPVR